MRSKSNHLKLFTYTKSTVILEVHFLSELVKRKENELSGIQGVQNILPPNTVVAHTQKSHL